MTDTISPPAADSAAQANVTPDAVAAAMAILSAAGLTYPVANQAGLAALTGSAILRTGSNGQPLRPGYAHCVNCGFPFQAIQTRPNCRVQNACDKRQHANAAAGRPANQSLRMAEAIPVAVTDTETVPATAGDTDTETVPNGAETATEPAGSNGAETVPAGDTETIPATDTETVPATAGDTDTETVPETVPAATPATARRNRRNGK